MAISFSIDDSSFRAKLKKNRLTMIQNAKNVVGRTAREAAEFAKSHTSQTKPGVRKGDGPRKVHPGGWADDTGNLANSIRAGEVKITPSGISAEFGVMADIEGSMEYAQELDDRDGYSVLAGADKEAQKALNRNAKHIVQ